MDAEDVMTTKVISVSPECSIQEVADILAVHKISAVPVISQERLVGSIGEDDLLRRTEIQTDGPPRSWWQRLLTSNDAIAEDYVRCHSTHVSDLMQRKVLTVAQKTPLTRVAELLRHDGTKWMPVINESEVVGIVTRGDIVRALARARKRQAIFLRSDQEICDEIVETLAHESWLISGTTRVNVKAGIVLFEGAFRCDGERKASVILAENIPGVLVVEDRREFFDLSFAAY